MKFAAAFDQGQFPTIAVVNLSTVGLGNDTAGKRITIDRMVGALQRSLDEHFTTIWGYPAKLQIFPDEKSIPPHTWPFLFIDNADAAGALGYHDIDKNGEPVSKIFTATTLADKEDISTTASHELFEVIADPGANWWANKRDGSLVAIEMSDPVEEQTFEIDGIKISNFVYPSYFEYWQKPKSRKFDHLGLLTRPFQIAKGGYLIVQAKGKVKQIFGSAAKARRFQKEDRRAHRSEYRIPERTPQKETK